MWGNRTTPVHEIFTKFPGFPLTSLFPYPILWQKENPYYGHRKRNVLPPDLELLAASARQPEP